MQLSQIRNFVAVAEAGSIRSAARSLGISQPAATKSVRALELELDAVLLQRTSRGISLTPAGQAFLTRARSVQSELQRARLELQQLAGEGGGTVAVGVASVVGAWLVPEVLQRFRGSWPGTSVRLVEGTQETLLPLLREGAIDFAVCLRLDRESSGGFNVRPLARLRLVVVGRKGHPLRRARTLRDLAGASWVMTRRRGMPGVLEHAFAADGIPLPDPVVECDSHGLKLAILSGSDALAVVSQPMLAEHGARTLLEEIPLERPLPLMTFAIYSRADTRLAPAARALSSLLASRCREVLRPA